MNLGDVNTIRVGGQRRKLQRPGPDVAKRMMTLGDRFNGKPKRDQMLALLWAFVSPEKDESPEDFADRITLEEFGAAVVTFETMMRRVSEPDRARWRHVFGRD